MKTALIYGATGLVGKMLTGLLLEHPSYSRIKVLVRKKMDLTHEKLEQVLFDFNQPDHTVVKADEVYCTLGTTIKTAGSQQAFYKVDHDYVINIAQIARANGVEKFGFVSSMGADKNSSIFYNKTKGQTEDDLVRMKFSTLFIARPSLLLGNRSEKRLGEQVAKWLMVKLPFLIPDKYKPIEAIQVAKALVQLMNSNKSGVHILESADLAKTG
jgi:uncharacterized protein YbjT (DUF2867 family)